MKPANAQYLVSLDDDNTVLCAHHTRTFEYVMTALNRNYQVYLIDPTEEPALCQACYLANVVLPEQYRSGNQKHQH
jgi:hypothetical protein